MFISRMAAFTAPAQLLSLRQHRQVILVCRTASSFCMNVAGRSFSSTAGNGTKLSAKNGDTLVIVESPAKARTIDKFLSDTQYRVRSCVGHIRDIPSSAKRIPEKYKSEPWARLGVDVENQFRPLYVLIEGKRKIISELREELQSTSELILATDEDREGEAISWHLVQVLKPNVPVRRAVFHEITEDAIKKGIASSRDIDMHLVKAQETRRILDRLAGYTMSPLLWKKIARGLSAGRVQSVAMSVIVQRELERLRFRSAKYVGCEATFESDQKCFLASLAAVDGVRMAKGSDFDGESGELREELKKSQSVVYYTEKELQKLLKTLKKSEAIIESVERKSTSRKPPSPFITSTLQQECGNKLGMGAGRTMRAAQKLYENGYITYMRTDNPALSEQAVKASHDAIASNFGEEHIAKEADTGKNSSRKPKAAQAAHEAIRPAGLSFKSPTETGLEGDERSVYELIYQRTLASQMRSANVDTTSIKISVPTETGKTLLFRTSGSIIVYPGFLLARNSSESDNEKSQSLPDVAENEVFELRDPALSIKETKPPPRYNDASLVKELEELGVGRPSTYASIIEVLIQRGYAFRGSLLGEHKGVPARALVPSLAAFAVEKLLSTHFPSYVDAEFTANMEKMLDEIAAGNADSVAYLNKYYCGDDGLAASVKRTESSIDPAVFRRIILPNMPSGMCEETVVNSKSSKAKTSKTAKRVRSTSKKGVDWSSTKLLVNSYGPYIERDGTVIASLPPKTLAEELNEENIESFIKLAEDPVIGQDPDSGKPVLLRVSRYGPYVQLGREEDESNGTKPKRSSLFPGMDAQNLNLDTALKLLQLPRLVGHHPNTGAEIRANRGPYGPYISYEGMYVSLKKDLHDLFTVTIEEALELIKEAEERKKKREERQAAKNARLLKESQQAVFHESENLKFGLGREKVSQSKMKATAGRKTASTKRV